MTHICGLTGALGNGVSVSAAPRNAVVAFEGGGFVLCRPLFVWLGLVKVTFGGGINDGFKVVEVGDIGGSDVGDSSSEELALAMIASRASPENCSLCLRFELGAALVPHGGGLEPSIKGITSVSCFYLFIGNENDKRVSSKKYFQDELLLYRLVRMR